VLALRIAFIIIDFVVTASLFCFFNIILVFGGEEER
jgi:hypothetical protein